MRKLRRNLENLGRVQDDEQDLMRAASTALRRKDLVAAKNKSLNNTIQSEITAAINSFDNITGYYEDAILATDGRVKIQQTMDALATLKETLENELKPFIIQYVVD